MVENPAGARVQELFAGDAPLGDDQTITAAFLTTQGVPTRYGRNRRDLDAHPVDALQAYLARHRPVRADLRGAVGAVQSSGYCPVAKPASASSSHPPTLYASYPSSRRMTAACPLRFPDRQ